MRGASGLVVRAHGTVHDVPVTATEDAPPFISAWATIPRRDRLAALAVGVAVLLLVGLRPIWQAVDPELDAIISFYELGSRTDPWGRPFLHYKIQRIARHSFTYSAGPNGIDDSGAACSEMERTQEDLPPYPWAWTRGDDFPVAYGHALSYAPARKLDHLWWWGRVIPIGALVVTIPYLALRQARTSTSPSVAVELLRAAFIGAPLAALAGLAVLALKVAPPAGTQTMTVVSWPVSIAASVELLLTIAVLWRRTRSQPAQS